jgi:hypothetical protein
MRMCLTICMLHILLMQVLLHVADVYAKTRSRAMNCSGLSSAGSTSLSVSRIQTASRDMAGGSRGLVVLAERRLLAGVNAGEVAGTPRRETPAPYRSWAQLYV